MRSYLNLEQTRREDISVAFNRFSCVPWSSDPDRMRDFSCCGAAVLRRPNEHRLWSLGIGREGGVRERRTTHARMTADSSRAAPSHQTQRFESGRRNSSS